MSLVPPWCSQSLSCSTACSLGARGYLEGTPIPPCRGPATSQPPLGLLWFPLSGAKDTFLAVIIGQAGQDGGQDPRRVGQHHPASQLDELPHPAHGRQLDQVIWKRNWWVPGGSARAAGVLPPTDHARRKGLEGTRGPELLLASLILSRLPKIHTRTTIL